MEVRPPVGPLEALKGIVLPRFRQNVQGLKVASEQLLPDLAKSVGAGTQSQPGVTASASGGKIRILYTKSGMPMEEEIYGVVEKLAFPIQTMTGVHTNLMWTVDYIFSFKSEQGKLDSHAKLFQTIVTSFKVNPKWFNKYNQVVEYLIQAQIKHIQNVGQLSRIISQTHNEISDQMMKSYEDRQKVYDKISDNFSHHIRGVDEYYNPLEGKTVELPSGYDNVWTNNLGEYVLSESPSYNPNVGSNLNWQKIEQTK
jgi:uncharacterized protein (UPF0297 family)